jgi:hypothetical protein
VACPRCDGDSGNGGSIRSVSSSAYTVFGEDFHVGPDTVVPASERGLKFGEMFWKLSEELLRQGAIKSQRLRIGQEGLKGVLDEGLVLLRHGKISGEKLVYRVGETPDVD